MQPSLSWQPISMLELCHGHVRAALQGLSLLTVWCGLHFSLLLPGEGIVQAASCQGARCPAPRGYPWRTSREVLLPGMQQN